MVFQKPDRFSDHDEILHDASCHGVESAASAAVGHHDPTGCPVRR
jgi:hypothetical protein